MSRIRLLPIFLLVISLDVMGQCPGNNQQDPMPSTGQEDLDKVMCKDLDNGLAYAEILNGWHEYILVTITRAEQLEKYLGVGQSTGEVRFKASDITQSPACNPTAILQEVAQDPKCKTGIQRVVDALRVVKESGHDESHGAAYVRNLKIEKLLDVLGTSPSNARHSDIAEGIRHVRADLANKVLGGQLGMDDMEPAPACISDQQSAMIALMRGALPDGNALINGTNSALKEDIKFYQDCAKGLPLPSDSAGQDYLQAIKDRITRFRSKVGATITAALPSVSAITYKIANSDEKNPKLVCESLLPYYAAMSSLVDDLPALPKNPQKRQMAWAKAKAIFDRANFGIIYYTGMLQIGTKDLLAECDKRKAEIRGLFLCGADATEDDKSAACPADDVRIAETASQSVALPNEKIALEKFVNTEKKNLATRRVYRPVETLPLYWLTGRAETAKAVRKQFCGDFENWLGKTACPLSQGEHRAQQLNCFLRDNHSIQEFCLKNPKSDSCLINYATGKGGVTIAQPHKDGSFFIGNAETVFKQQWQSFATASHDVAATSVSNQATASTQETNGVQTAGRPKSPVAPLGNEPEKQPENWQSAVGFAPAASPNPAATTPSMPSPEVSPNMSQERSRTTVAAGNQKLIDDLQEQVRQYEKELGVDNDQEEVSSIKRAPASESNKSRSASIETASTGPIRSGGGSYASGTSVGGASGNQSSGPSVSAPTPAAPVVDGLLGNMRAVGSNLPPMPKLAGMEIKAFDEGQRLVIEKSANAKGAIDENFVVSEVKKQLKDRSIPPQGLVVQYGKSLWKVILEGGKMKAIPLDGNQPFLDKVELTRKYLATYQKLQAALGRATVKPASL